MNATEITTSELLGNITTYETINNNYNIIIVFINSSLQLKELPYKK